MPVAAGARVWRAARFALTLWGIYLGPLAIGVILYLSAVEHQTVFDFAATIYNPGRDVLAGRSPYPAAELSAIAGHPTFVYPPTMLAFDVPLSLLPYAVARWAWALTCGAALAGALRVVGVRDPRCYALALFSVPAIQGLAMGNVTVLLVLLLALAWRYRDHAVVGGLAIGLLVGIKLLLWPLFVWLLATRRLRTAGSAVGFGAIAVIGSWALIGFKGIVDYPDLVRLVGSETAGPRSLTVMTLAHSAGAPDVVGRGLQWALAVLLLGLAMRLARGQDGDRRAFSVVVVAALVLTPVMWLHYFLFLLIPIALLEPRLAPAWAMPAAFWLLVWFPQGKTYYVFDGAHNLGPFGVVPSVPRLVVALSVLAATVALTATAPRVRALRLPRRGLDLRPVVD
jgi:hypothetical protein